MDEPEPNAMDLEDLRLAVYRGFARDGHAPDRELLAAALGTAEDTLAAGLRRLHEARHVVLGADAAEYFRSVGLYGPFWRLPD